MGRAVEKRARWSGIGLNQGDNCRAETNPGAEGVAQAKRSGYRNPKKGQCSPAFGLQRSFPLIRELAEQYGIADCCRVFEVSRSGYYAWRQRQGKTSPKREELKLALIKYHKASRGSAGSRTLSEDLQGADHQVGRHMARNLMRDAGIASSLRRAHKYKSSCVRVTGG